MEKNQPDLKCHILKRTDPAAKQHFALGVVVEILQKNKIRAVRGAPFERQYVLSVHANVVHRLAGERINPITREILRHHERNAVPAENELRPASGFNFDQSQRSANSGRRDKIRAQAKPLS